MTRHAIITKRNIYISLTALCLLSIVLLNTFYAPKPNLKKEFKLSINKEKIAENANPYIFILSMTYLTIFTVGLFNLISLLIRKIQKKPLLDILEKKKPYPLGQEQTSKLLFLIVFVVFLSYLAQYVVYFLKWNINLIGIFLTLNLAIEIITIIIILNFLSEKFLEFRLKKIHLLSSVKIYTAILPVVLGALLLNAFLAEKLGIKLSPNPAVEIFLLLKNNFLIFMLAAQLIIFGPVAEELFFRGFIYKLIRKKYSFMSSSILTSLAFAFMHKTPQNILPLFIISFSLCYLYEKTQNIATPILFHALNNSLNLSFLITLKSLI
jgi:membrane protease YdiL (CAAX protease family)